MIALCVFPLSFSCPPQTAILSGPIQLAKRSSSSVATLRQRPGGRTGDNNVVVRSSNSDDPKESAFFDENGVVDDMDGYLNYLSLEYDSIWDTKPSWCQPWTITLTGVLIIVFSWLTLQSVLVSSIVLSLICLWWFIFLYSYPKEYSDMIAERRRKITSGVQDTFGVRKSQ